MPSRTNSRDGRIKGTSSRTRQMVERALQLHRLPQYVP